MLPSAVASIGPASTGRRAARRQPAQQLVACTAADHVHDLDLAPGDALEPLEHEPVLASERKERERTSLTAASGAGCPAAQAARSGGHIAGAQEAIVVGVEERHVGARAVSARAALRTTLPQLTATLLHQPQPHHVAQQRIVPSTPRSFVRLNSSARSAQHGPVSSRPSSDQVPRRGSRRAGGGAAPPRTPTPCRGWPPRARRRPIPVVGEDGPERRAGLDRVAGERRRGESEPLDQPARPGAAARVEQPRGRGVGDLVDQLTGEPVGEEVGNSAIRSAAAARASARSWKTVLIGIVWMPVTAYSSATGTRAKARAAMPSVRASR